MFLAVGATAAVAGADSNSGSRTGKGEALDMLPKSLIGAEGFATTGSSFLRADSLTITGSLTATGSLIVSKEFFFFGLRRCFFVV
jgi:hypothetical protein